MNIFITGATGFIGGYFLRMLLQKAAPSDQIFILSRQPWEAGDKRVHVVVGNLETIENHAEVLKSCQYVFHIGGDGSIQSKEDFNVSNCEPTRKMVEILKSSPNLKNFIFTSSIGAQDRAKGESCDHPLGPESAPNPRTPYGRSKWKCECTIRNSGIPFTIFRPTWVYGPGMRYNSHLNFFASIVAKKSFFTRLNLPGVAPLIHVKDLCLAMLGSIDNPKVVEKTYLAVTENKTLGEVFSCLHQKIRGQTPSLFCVPFAKSFFSRFHGFVPFSLAVVFAPLLWAKDDQFIADFNLKNPVLMEDGIEDVLATNKNVRGWWVITGAGSGIGLALAKKLSARNERLILLDKNIDALVGLKSPTIQTLKIDLTRAEEIRQACLEIQKFPLKCLINNAGVGFRGGLAELDWKKVETMLEVNIQAPLLMTHTLMRHLRHHQTTIVNTLSSIATHPLPGMSIYSASKAFLSNWSESLAYELKETNTVVSFSPSGTHTQFQSTGGVKVVKEGKGLLPPEKVAKALERAAQGKNWVVNCHLLGTKILLRVSWLLPRKLAICFWVKLFSLSR